MLLLEGFADDGVVLQNLIDHLGTMLKTVLNGNLTQISAQCLLTKPLLISPDSTRGRHRSTPQTQETAPQ